MADNNNFWEEKDDDFWKKPVISDDWLKDEKTNADKNAGFGDNPYAEAGNPWGQNSSENVFGKEQAEWDDPFANLRGDEPQYGIPNQPAYTYTSKTAAPSRKTVSSVGKTAASEQRTADTAKRKNLHVHTIICLIFIGMAVLSVAASAVASKLWFRKAAEINKILEYQEISTTGSFPVYTNNAVTLDGQAYTIIGPGELSGDAADKKLIAVYAQVESDEYVRGQYALKDMFIGYEADGQNQFRRCLRSEEVLNAASGLGFTKDDLLATYGAGNGSDDYGFYFFYVPEEVNEITFYAEEREERMEISVVIKRYKTVLEVWDIADMDVSELISEKRESSQRYEAGY